MDEDALISRVLHLRQVEKLSQQQIADKLGIGRKRVRRMLKGQDGPSPLRANPFLISMSI